jgi:hypothetical protein
MIGAVLARVLAAAATAWSVVYLVAYLWVIDGQDGAIAWWYVVLMVLAALNLALAAFSLDASRADCGASHDSSRDAGRPSIESPQPA